MTTPAPSPAPPSPAALAALQLPLSAESSVIVDADDKEVFRICTRRGSYRHDCEIAAFIAALVNAALLPPAPVVVEPDSNAELRQAAG